MIIPEFAIDDELIREAQTISKNDSVIEVIRTAIAEYVRLHQQMAIFELAGTIDYDPDYDYKKERFRK